MNLGMFYRSVRFVVGAAVLMASAPVLAMNVAIGQYVEVRGTNATFKVVGAKIADEAHVTLDLQNVASGQTFELTVQNQPSIDDVPELTPPAPKAYNTSRTLPMLY